MVRNFFLVGLGGAVGSMLRYGASLVINSSLFPFATLTVNIAGSFIIGLVMGLALKEEYFLHNWRLFLATGICGGFTTFSSFAAENLELIQSGKTLLAIIYILSSVVSGIIAVWLGYKILNV